MIGLALKAFSLDVVSSIADGIVFMLLWEWFVVPTFGVLPISVPAAIGLMLLVRLSVASSTGGEWRWAEAVGAIITRPLAALLFGLIFSQFM